MVTPLMGADLNNIFKTQRLSDDHIQFLTYQILRALKVPSGECCFLFVLSSFDESIYLIFFFVWYSRVTILSVIN